MMKKIIRTSIISVALILLVLLAMVLLPFGTTKAFDANDYGYDSRYSKEFDNIPVISQETGYTCYAVSMAIVKTYLGAPTTETDMLSELDMLNRGKGMLPDEYLSCANEVFEPLSYSVSLVTPNSQAEILNVITDSLANDLPVVIFYAAEDDWNKPNYNTHYGVIYGIDMRNETVKLSNPYGYLEELSFAELFGSLDFKSYQSEPWLFRLGRRVGMIRENNLFILEKHQSL